MSSFVLAVIEDLGADLDPSTRYASLMLIHWLHSGTSATHVSTCLAEKGRLGLEATGCCGLAPDSLGSRLNEASRLNAIVTYRGVTHFPNKSTLPDPYDGLLEGVHAGDLNVHDCMGLRPACEWQIVEVPLRWTH